MAWWQKKLLRYGLRYGLSRSGLLDDTAIDLDNLDITIGRQNVIELRDVGLNIQRITALARLPPGLRLQTARVLHLKLTIPADFYQSSIVVEVDGVEVVAQFDDIRHEQTSDTKQARSRSRSPETARTPQHRKTHRWTDQRPSHDRGGAEQGVRLPNVQDVAKSFLLDEPANERRDLEALAYGNSGIENSFASESSDGEAGTGTGVGVPGFLTNFLQGIVERFQLIVNNIEVRIETGVQGDIFESLPVALRLRIGAVVVGQVDLSKGDKSREVAVDTVSLDLLSKDEVIAELSSIPSRSSMADKQSAPVSPAGLDESILAAHATTENFMDSTAPYQRKQSSPDSGGSSNDMMQSAIEPPTEAPRPQRSDLATSESAAAEQLESAYGDESYVSEQSEHELEIQAGDDNISWGSRRSKSSVPANDPWSSMVSNDQLRTELLFAQSASTVRTHDSRSSSPLTLRQRRAVSPYDRGISSSGSWPKPEKSHPAPHGTGSWPSLQQDHPNILEPLDQHLTSGRDDMADNKDVAKELAHSESLQGELRTPPGEPSTIGDSMVQSRTYSPGAGQSMYMSALTGVEPSNMPGGWDSEDAQSTQSTPRKATASPEPPSPVAILQTMSQLDGAQASIDAGAENKTPRAQTPTPEPRPSTSEFDPEELAIRHLLHIDQLKLSIPPQDSQSSATEPAHAGQAGRASSRPYAPRGMPGTFSAYSDLSASRRRGVSSIRAESGHNLWESKDETSKATVACPVVVDLGTVSAQLDISTVQLLYRVFAAMTHLFESPYEDDLKKADSDVTEQYSNPVTVHLHHLHVHLTDCIDPCRTLADASTLSSHGLLDLALRDTNLSIATTTSLQIGDLEFLLGGQDLLVFQDTSNSMTESSALTGDAPAIAVKITKNTLAATGSSVTEIMVQTKPVRLDLNLDVFDETFNAFGGISGILELGNSVLKESVIRSPATAAASKSVRFVEEQEAVKSNNEIKVNSHIGGFTTSISSNACTVTTRTSMIRLVYRESGVMATASRVSIRGPYYGTEMQDAPLSIELANIRVDYLLTPQDNDLERLLSLLTPSRDKYDGDDDIIIPTLLKQRREGALLRLSLSDLKAKLESFDCVPALSSLADDLAKLSAVAKYLPEDDKAGLLTLLLIKDAEACLPVTDRFGTLLFALQDLHLSHVGLPSLLAFSIGDVFARQTGGPELLHSLLPLAGSDSLPVVMARMIDNEAEPIKVKLFNLCFEYSVPILQDLTGLDGREDPEEMMHDIAQSIANLAAKSDRKPFHSPISDSPGRLTKRLGISLSVHDSAIGLKPDGLPSKALLVLNDAHMATTVPTGDEISIKLEIRKAAIFVTDQTVDETSSEPTPSSSNSVLRLSNALCQRGFVSVGSIMSAVVDFRAREGAHEAAPKMVEVDVRNELFLLETCADSTQTLFATLGALVPPSLPSKEPKFLTEPMPIEDMMASFSGDPFVQPDETPEMLFDVEGDPDDIDPDGLLGVSTFEDAAGDWLADSQMTSSLHGPVSGLLGVDQNDEEADDLEGYPETAESLLEEDPFEMTTAPEDAHLGDAALLRDLNRQSQPVASSEPVDLGLYEIEDLGFDALGSGQQALGDRHRFNAPFVGKRGVGPGRPQQDLPFRLRLRDFNFIWHLHDGYDWQRTRNGIVDAVEKVEQRAEERKARRRRSRQDPDDDESVIGDFLFNSIYIGVPADVDTHDIRRQINRGIDQDISETESVPVSGISRPTIYSATGQPRHRQSQRRRLKIGRSRSHKIAFELKAVSADVSVFPPGSHGVVSSVDLRVKDFEIFDKVPTSTWRKFLTHLHNDPATREMSKPMFHIQLDNVKTLESHSASEIVLHVTVLPLRLHVDQDALDFITRFFEFKDPEMVSSGEPGERPFLQRIEIDTVELCLDYKPKNVDYAGLRSGRTKEFMNFITLEGCNIRLKHAIIYGLQGFDLLHDTLSDVWTPDVIQNQLPKVLSGLAPVRSLVNLGIGVRDVVAIPIREYRKDGRIVRAIQKGAFHFGKTTTAELARLGAKVALGTQTMLSNAEELLAPGSTAAHQSRMTSGWHETGHISDDDDAERQRAVSAYANQPLGVLSGLRSARRHLEHDLLTAKDALIAVQGEVLESRGPGDVAGAVVKHAPTVILRPVIGATRAVGTALLGVGNAVDRGNLRRVDDKYKRR